MSVYPADAYAGVSKSIPLDDSLPAGVIADSLDVAGPVAGVVASIAGARKISD